MSRSRPRRSRSLLVATIVAAALTTVASAAKRAVVIAGGGAEDTAAGRIRDSLTARGFTVTKTGSVPGNLSDYCCAYDLRSFDALTAGDRNAYRDFLRDGHGLLMTGENQDCCTPRNDSIVVFIRDTLGGGGVSITGQVLNIYTEDSVGGHPIVSGVGQVTWDGFGGGIFGSAGRGQIVTENAALNSRAAAVWDEGRLDDARPGRLVATLDINWLVETFDRTDNERFLDNISAFLCPQIEAEFDVNITEPNGFTKECPNTVTVEGRVIGTEEDCAQPTTLRLGAEPVEPSPPPSEYLQRGGPTGDGDPTLFAIGAPPEHGVFGPDSDPQSLLGRRISDIDYRLNGGGWNPVTSTTPNLPADAPVDFTAADIPLVLGGNTIEIRARSLGSDEFDSVSGTLRDTTPPVIRPPTCLDETVDLGPGCRLQYNKKPIADDTCDPDVAVTTIPNLPFTFSGPGFQDFDYTARDDSGNTDTCRRRVTAEDIGGPVIDCPAALTLECTQAGGRPEADPDIVAWLDAATVTDNCDPDPPLRDDHPPFFDAGCSPGLGTIVTWESEDDSGNPAECRSTLFVEDTTPPEITSTPAPLTLECNVPGGVDTTDPDVQAWLAEFQADDLCLANAALSNDAPLLFPAGCEPGRATTVNFHADDDCSNRASFAEDLTVVDTTEPTLTVPAPLELECNLPGGVDRDDPAVLAWLATAVADDICGAVTIANDLPPLIPSGCGGLITTVTFTATDDCGNAVSLTSEITVTDTTAPTLTVPADLALECNSPGGVEVGDPEVQAWLASAVADDVCGGLTITHDTPALLPSGCGLGATTTVTFTATDDCGNEIQKTADITVQDTTEPQLTVPPALVLECNSPGGVELSDPEVQAWLNTAAATDVCDGATITDDAPALFPSGCGAGAETTVTFTAVDNCGNEIVLSSTITVKDTTEPVLTVPAPLELECNSPGGIAIGDPEVQSWLNSATATDVCDGATIDHDAPALFASSCGAGLATTVTFTAVDNCGNEMVLSSTITVKDTTEPDLDVPAPLELECNAAGGVDASDPDVVAWLAAASATDVCDGATLSDDAPAFFPSGCGAGTSTTVNFEAVDDCSNLAEGASTVTVKDTTAPDLTVPLPIVLECNSPGGVPSTDPDIQSWLNAASASDICNGVTVSNDAPALFGAGCPPGGGVTTVTFTAVDDCGNEMARTSTVTVVDTTPPTLTVPLPLELECNGPGGVPANDPEVQAWLLTAAASDVCGGTTVTDDAPLLFPSGCVPGSETTVTFTAVDDCGNATAATSTIRVADTTPPEVLAVMIPAAPLPPSSPQSVCSPPNSREFIIDCGIVDTCDPDAVLTPKLLVTSHEVLDEGMCAEVIEQIPVECGELVELRLVSPPCPKKPRSAGTAVSVISGVKVITGEAIILEATGVDNCGNTAVGTYDPTREPSELCDEVLEDGTCCPAIAVPEDPDCKLPLCGRCQPSAAPPPVAPGVSAAGEGCTKEEAQRAALDDVASVCSGALDPGCGGTCRPIDAGCEVVALARKKAPKTGFDCEKAVLASCAKGKGYRCELSGAIDCGCACR